MTTPTPPLIPPHAGRPLVGVTMDLVDDQARLRRTYLRAVHAAGGLGIPLMPLPGTAEDIVGRLDGLILTGGDDPDTTAFGAEVHPQARLVDPDRQRFELELLEGVEAIRPDLPVLGVCLGMQFMGLKAGGTLDQHLPDHLPSAADHWDGARHEVHGDLTGVVHSHHRQALLDAGNLEVVATAKDGVIEAIRRPERPFQLGVQWHPERTDDDAVGLDLFRRLVAAAGARG